LLLSDLDAAYAEQAAALAGVEPVGYKVGCTSRAIREQFGLTEPVSGVLSVLHQSGASLPAASFTNCAVEPEFVLRIAADGRSVESVAVGIELHNYVFHHQPPTSHELVASNALHAGVVVGTLSFPLPEANDLSLEGLGLWINGELVASGIGAEIMGGPLVSLRWLVDHLDRRGVARGLRPGDIVIPGSPVGLFPVSPGDAVEVRSARFGSASCSFT
jgi:2-keto-4-pentenoate hydratase